MSKQVNQLGLGTVFFHSQPIGIIFQALLFKLILGMISESGLDIFDFAREAVVGSQLENPARLWLFVVI
jgi:hypothetical protein